MMKIIALVCAALMSFLVIQPMGSATLDDSSRSFDSDTPPNGTLIPYSACEFAASDSLKSSRLIKVISFSGIDWNVRRSGSGGPGPNRWDERNVWVDERGELHLKLEERDGNWYCSELQTQKPLGFGRYQFWIVGRLDDLDPNVVFGLFNYPTRDVGPDGTHEIDIEFARWGRKSTPIGNFTVWPTRKGLKQTSHSFAFTLNGDQSTHRFVWSSTGVSFQSLHGHVDDDQNEYSSWKFAPTEPADAIAQKEMPLHINLWCFKGRPPTDGKPVELIVRAFKFSPE